MANPRVVLVGNVGGTDLTDDLLFAGTVRLLMAIEASVVAVSSNPEHTRRTHGVAAVSNKIPLLLRHLMSSADMVLLVGGRVVTDLHGPRCLARNLVAIPIARSAGTAVLPYGIEVGPIDTPVGRQIAQSMLSLTTAGLVRDRASAAALTALGAPEPSVAPDLGFALQPPLVRSQERIVVCLRPVPAAGEEAFVTAAAAALDEVSARTALPIRFVALHAGRDDRIQRRVGDRMTSHGTTHVVADLRGVLQELGQSRVVVTMRHHGLVGGVLGGRPGVGIDHLGELGGLVAELRGLHPDIASIVGPDPHAIEGLPDAVEQVLGRDADVIDAREAIRSRLIRARSVIERTLHAT